MNDKRGHIVELLKETYLNSIPVDLERIAKDSNITVKTRHMGSLSGKIMKIPACLPACLRRQACAGPPADRDNDVHTHEITINVLHPHTRRRFTLAHELAHFFLHKELIGNGIFDDPLYRSSLSNTLEVEANKLAADIFMPLHKIGERVEYYITDFEMNIDEKLARTLAEEFDVSFGSMCIRLGI